jgi:hypothetical protein
MMKKTSKKTAAMKPHHNNDPPKRCASDSSSSLNQKQLWPRTIAQWLDEQTRDQAQSKRKV